MTVFVNTPRKEAFFFVFREADSSQQLDFNSFTIAFDGISWSFSLVQMCTNYHLLNLKAMVQSTKLLETYEQKRQH